MMSYTEEGGVRRWYENNLLHREDGPAMEFNEIHGILLYEDDDGIKSIREGYKSWYLRGVKIRSYKEFQEKTGHSDAYISYLKLKYGEME